MRTPSDKRIKLTLYSHPEKQLARRWKAYLVFEPNSTDDTPAVLTIEDGCGVPISEGVFAFAGQRLPVKEGRAEIRCGDFVSGKHEPGIWLFRPKMEPVPGALTFE